ncbi:hypothetical protein [Chryseobacterium wanjuense]|nr:hypothetical protein [Chryseobacterium wanjuense]
MASKQVNQKHIEYFTGITCKPPYIRKGPLQEADGIILLQQV